jgi:hypothetical protein
VPIADEALAEAGGTEAHEGLPLVENELAAIDVATFGATTVERGARARVAQGAVAAVAHARRGLGGTSGGWLATSAARQRRREESDDGCGRGGDGRARVAWGQGPGGDARERQTLETYP